MITTTFVPTYLYIKQHSITNKLYFGKTIGDPNNYLGSGTYWLNHINKHGTEHVITLWYELFEHENECVNFALEFSNKMDIVTSKSWLNLIPENAKGITRETIEKMQVAASNRKQVSVETSRKLSENKRNRVVTDETKKKLSELGKRVIFTEERRKNIGATFQGKKQSEAHILKRTALITGKKRTPEQCKNISLGLRGKKLSETARNNMSISRLGKKQEIISCIHCGYSAGKNSITRYHNNNCKNKGNNI